MQHAKKKYRATNLSFLRGCADAIPLANHKIELAVRFETLEHLDSHDEIMSELRRVLKTDRRLIISTSEKRYYSNEFHVKELYDAEIHDLLARQHRNIRLMHQRILYTSVIDAEEADGSIDFYKGDYGRISKIHMIEKAPYLAALASDGVLSPMKTSLFDGKKVLIDLQMKREQDLRRREADVIHKEAELQKLHNLLPINLYRAIRDPSRSYFECAHCRLPPAPTSKTGKIGQLIDDRTG
jgi:SAM-dependent methyltransferase